MLSVYNVIKSNISSHHKINTTVANSETLPVLNFQHRICAGKPKCWWDTEVTAPRAGAGKLAHWEGVLDSLFQGAWLAVASAVSSQWVKLPKRWGLDQSGKGDVVQEVARPHCPVCQRGRAGRMQSGVRVEKKEWKQSSAVFVLDEWHKPISKYNWAGVSRLDWHLLLTEMSPVRGMAVSSTSPATLRLSFWWQHAVMAQLVCTAPLPAALDGQQNRSFACCVLVGSVLLLHCLFVWVK